MNSLEKYDRLAKKFRWKLGLILYFRQFLGWAAVVMFLWGVVVLVLKGLSLDTLWYQIVPGTALIAPVVISLVWMLRSLPDPARIKAMLDLRVAGGGLITASDEIDIQQWMDRIPNERSPRLSWRGGRVLTPFILSIVFLGVAFAIPARLIAAAPNRLDIGEELDQFNQQLAVLEEEQILDEEQLQEYRKDIADLDKKAAAGDSGGMWEAMDHLDNSLEKVAEKEALDMLKELRQNRLAQELAQALNQNQDQLPAGALDAAVEQLSQLATGSVPPEALEEAGISPEAWKELLAKIQSGQLSEGECTQMQQILGQCGQCQGGKIGRLVDARLLDGKFMKLCEKAGECDPEALLAYLSQCEGMTPGDCQALCQLPGKGGVTRGRGDAALTWKDETQTADMGFKEAVLPPGSLASLRDSQIQGVSIGDPGTEEPLGPSGSGALAGASATGGTARTHTVLPVHRNSVNNYFNRNK